jgi:hypothetical protein
MIHFALHYPKPRHNALLFAQQASMKPLHALAPPTEFAQHAQLEASV